MTFPEIAQLNAGYAEVVADAAGVSTDSVQDMRNRHGKVSIVGTNYTKIKFYIHPRKGKDFSDVKEELLQANLASKIEAISREVVHGLDAPERFRLTAAAVWSLEGIAAPSVQTTRLPLPTLATHNDTDLILWLLFLITICSMTTALVYCYSRRTLRKDHRLLDASGDDSGEDEESPKKNFINGRQGSSAREVGGNGNLPSKKYDGGTFET